MNNIEIIKLIESKSGEIPMLIKTQLLEIYEAYEKDINKLNLKNFIFQVWTHENSNESEESAEVQQKTGLFKGSLNETNWLNASHFITWAFTH